MCCYFGEQLRVGWLDCGSRLKTRVVQSKDNGLRGAGLLFVLAACQRRLLNLKLLGRGVCRFDAYTTNIFRVSCLVRCGLTSNDELSSRSSL